MWGSLSTAAILIDRNNCVNERHVCLIIDNSDATYLMKPGIQQWLYSLYNHGRRKKKGNMNIHRHFLIPQAFRNSSGMLTDNVPLYQIGDFPLIGADDGNVGVFLASKFFLLGKFATEVA